jgi:hypothetical protein
MVVSSLLSLICLSALNECVTVLGAQLTKQLQTPFVIDPINIQKDGTRFRFITATLSELTR